MYKAEPNQTKNRPQELPYLVRDTTTNLIIRYCPDQADAKSHGHRLNEVHYKEAAVEETALPADPSSNPATQFTLF